MQSGDKQGDDDLKFLRYSAHQTLLRDVEFTDDHARRIMQHALANSPTSRARSMKSWIPALSGVATLALVCVMGVPMLHQELSHSARSTSGDWKTGFLPISGQQVIDQFQNVSDITFSEGRFAGPTTPTVKVHLTGTQQRQLFQIMKTSRERTDGVTPEPTTLEWNISFMSSKNSMEGSYRGDGAMILPGDIGSGQTHADALAPNPRLAQFINQVVMPKYLDLMRSRQRILMKSAAEAANLFMRDLHTPTLAYRYCFTDVMFNDALTFRGLASESIPYKYGSYHVAKVIKYLYGGSAALVDMQSTVSESAPHVQLRILKVGDAWLISEIGRNLTENEVSGNPLSLSEPFGDHHVLVVGPAAPSADQNTRVTQIPQSDATDASFAKADIIVYERPGISGKANQRLPDKFSMGHPDQRAVKQLQDSPSFQRAVTEAKRRHIPLIVVGNSDRLLNEWFMKFVLNDQGGGFSISSGGASYVVIHYQTDGSVTYSDGVTAGPNNGQISTAQIVQDALSGVELSLDMGG